MNIRLRATSRVEAVEEHVPSLAARAAILLVEAYRAIIASWIPPSCRYVPSCSQYALDALSTHGLLRGAWATLRRILRCHPLGGSGWDPVPPRSDRGGRPGSTRGRLRDAVGTQFSGGEDRREEVLRNG